MDRATAAPDIYTIGHSTHAAADFIALLRLFRVARVIDVRTIPRSRHNPQFDSATLQTTLAVAGIAYTHRPDLGGLRKPEKDSPNRGWHNSSFRGFADYMQTPAFAAAMEWLVEVARSETTALMCAERLPWRCHRSLIADALAVRGLRVCHIMPPDQCRLHTLTPWARVANGAVLYPPEITSPG